METRKLKTISIYEALTGMSVGETCVSPDNMTVNQVKRATWALKKKGYWFTTRVADGIQYVTRMK
ncbi:MAG: hypothetical protein HDR79_08155 [Bacteroides sp.]|nr:hypothetical protein [Bacteroides sp.]